jgi:hypothetical protein
MEVVTKITTSGSEEGKVIGIGLLEICSRGKNLSIWAEFCVWGEGRQNYNEIVIANDLRLT